MACTPFAESMLPELRSALSKLRSVALTRPGFDPRTAQRKIKIAASDYVASIFITELVQKTAELAPHVSISLVPMGPEANSSFERGDLDAIILPEGALSFSQHPKLVLFSDQFICVARADNASIGDSLTMDQYYSLNRIVPPFNNFWPEQQLDDSAKIHSGVTLSLPFSAAPWLVSRSDYIAILPERLVVLFESWLRLRRVRLPQVIARAQFIAQWHADTAKDPFKLWLLDQMHELGVALEASGASAAG